VPLFGKLAGIAEAGQVARTLCRADWLPRADTLSDVVTALALRAGMRPHPGPASLLDALGLEQRTVPSAEPGPVDSSGRRARPQREQVRTIRHHTRGPFSTALNRFKAPVG
jgi:hypothetical protein